MPSAIRDGRKENFTLLEGTQRRAMGN